MYRGFNLKGSLTPHKFFQDIGNDLFVEQQQQVQKKLNKFLLPNNSLNGTEIQENWFPEIDAHIFLSHSHEDEETALILAGWLYRNFGLKTFIDSTVWGYSHDLLKIIDNTYCLNPGGETYSYEKRNYSTSHVHLMLAAALNKMIDSCECIFFMNTPNSISSNADTERTSSPWIYTEIVVTQTIQKKTPDRLRAQTRTFSKGENLNEGPKIEYELELSHLRELDFGELIGIFKSEVYSPEDALDKLYRHKPISDYFYK